MEGTQNVQNCMKFAKKGDDVISREDYVIYSTEPPSWISQFLKNSRKPSMLNQKLSKAKVIKSNTKTARVNLTFLAKRKKIKILENVAVKVLLLWKHKVM